MKEATRLNVTLELPVMDGQREVRCAEEQEHACFLTYVF